MKKRKLINVGYLLTFILVTGLIYYYDILGIWTISISIILILFSIIETRIFKLDQNTISEIKNEKSDSDKTLLILQSVLLIMVIGGQVLRHNGIKHENVIGHFQLTVVLVMVLVFQKIKNKRKRTHVNNLG